LTDEFDAVLELVRSDFVAARHLSYGAPDLKKLGISGRHIQEFSSIGFCIDYFGL
jgi:hypothetical protein